MSIKPRAFKTLRRLAHKIIERVRALKSSLVTTQGQLSTLQGQAQNLNQRVNTLEGQDLHARLTAAEAAIQALQEQQP